MEQLTNGNIRASKNPTSMLMDLLNSLGVPSKFEVGKRRELGTHNSTALMIIKRVKNIELKSRKTTLFSWVCHILDTWIHLFPNPELQNRLK
jgi:hypothetical protein